MDLSILHQPNFVTVAWILCLIFIIIFIFGLIRKMFRKTLLILCLLSMCNVISVNKIHALALDHGLYAANITIRQAVKSIQNTPKEDELPDDPAGNLIIVYRFGCGSCEAIHKDLDAYLTEQNVDPIYVSSRSPQGKNLLDNYPITSVPTAIYIYHYPEQHEDAYVRKPLCIIDNDGTRLDIDAVDDMIGICKRQL